MQIEVRIQATNSNVMRGDYDESHSINLDVDPVTAKSILDELDQSGFLADYITNNDVSANTREKPQLLSELTQGGEFFFDLPVLGMNHTQSFRVRIIL